MLSYCYNILAIRHHACDAVFLFPEHLCKYEYDQHDNGYHYKHAYANPCLEYIANKFATAESQQQ